MWLFWQARLAQLFEDRVGDAQAQTMGTALRAILDAARARPSDEAVDSAQLARQQRARKA